MNKDNVTEEMLYYDNANATTLSYLSRLREMFPKVSGGPHVHTT